MLRDKIYVTMKTIPAVWYNGLFKIFDGNNIIMIKIKYSVKYQLSITVIIKVNKIPHSSHDKEALKLQS